MGSLLASSEPQAQSRLPQDRVPGSLIETEFVREDPEVLRVRHLRAPELTGKVAPPDAPLRSEGPDDRAAGIVHVAARILLGGSGRNKGQLGVHVRQPGQSQHVF